ncbi:MAG: hypothetical protein QOJ07_1978 [Thermoleophilaceae bacterium]|nr:hypothetical protein [Thermoleophilaceae bacterium]
MIRRVLALAFVASMCLAALLLTGAKEEKTGTKIKIVLDNAFGLTEGGDLRVGGVNAGTTDNFGITKGNLCVDPAHKGGPPRTCAIVEATISEPGFNQFKADAHCDVRQQSLIGEYYVDCQPGQSKANLPNNTVPIIHTTSTIPADLVQNIMRRPYRERFRLIVSELGTGLAGRPQDLATLLRKAHPGLRETTKTLNILASQTTTIKNFISDSDAVVAQLENNKRDVARWVVAAERASATSASVRGDIERGFQRFPGFLDQLRPTMAKLGQLTDAQTPLLADLQRSAPALNETLTRLGPFAQATRPSVRSLGNASVKGTRALRASDDEIAELRKLAANAPALGKPLRQLLQTADDRSRGRPDARVAQTAPPSPDPTSLAKSKGKGFTAFEDLLNYVYWQTLSINEFDSFSHQLRVLLIIGSECAPYANSAEAKKRPQCNSYLGPYQPGISAKDPTADPASAARLAKTKQKKGQTRGAGAPEALPTPGQPDPSKPQYALPPGLQALADQATKTPHQQPAAGAAAGSSGQSQQAPEQLLDFLLAP